MAQNKIFEYAPQLSTGALLPLAVFNVGNSLAGSIGIISSQPYAILKHIRLINVLTTTAVVVGLYKGATTTSLSTQTFAFSSVSIPASSYVDWYGQARVETADYINLVANLATSTIIQIDGEIGIC
jgi:hypothetical protein